SFSLPTSSLSSPRRIHAHRSLAPRRPTRSPSVSFRRSVAHRDLHSFPTRRSSDLSGGVLVRRGGAFERLERAAGARRAAQIRRRSEEHTSELQSRVDLVCRLLLEKKKQHNNSSRPLRLIVWPRHTCDIHATDAVSP